MSKVKLVAYEGEWSFSLLEFCKMGNRSLKEQPMANNNNDIGKVVWLKDQIIDC